MNKIPGKPYHLSCGVCFLEEIAPSFSKLEEQKEQLIILIPFFSDRAGFGNMSPENISWTVCISHLGGWVCGMFTWTSWEGQPPVGGDRAGVTGSKVWGAWKGRGDPMLCGFWPWGCALWHWQWAVITLGRGMRWKVGMVWFYNQSGQDEFNETLQMLS